jgi:thiol-disulfide isomerase/thioredoxin
MTDRPPMTRHVRTRVLALAAAAALALSACGSGGGGEGRTLPDLELPRLDGTGTLQLSSVDGPAVVNLWATWCAPCRREMPEFEEVHLEREGEVRFIGVNIGDREDRALTFLDEVGVTFENYLDFDGALNAELETVTLPVTVVTDAEGRISVVHSGPMDVDDLNREIERALAPTP